MLLHNSTNRNAQKSDTEFVPLFLFKFFKKHLKDCFCFQSSIAEICQKSEFFLIEILIKQYRKEKTMSRKKVVP